MENMGGKRMIYDFQERLEFSKGARQSTDLETIASLLDGCRSVVAAPKSLDVQGVDYIATLRRGAEVYIDAKTRTKGCSRYWRFGEPELAIEKWSVMPAQACPQGKTGWTLDEAKVTDMVLYTFDKSDSPYAYLLPFQSLRMAARRMIEVWMQIYKVDRQTSNQSGRTYHSQAVLVPASVVFAAIESTYKAESP